PGPGAELDPADRDSQDETGEPRVQENDVTAAAQDVHRQAPLDGVGECRANLFLATALDEVAGRPPEPECRKRGEGHVFAQLHALILHALVQCCGAATALTVPERLPWNVRRPNLP